jgi:predicted aminopeptidase
MNSGRAARASALALPLLLLLLPACNPIYVVRAGWAQARILALRKPLTEVMTDPAVDSATRASLRLVHDARLFAIEELGFQNAGESYTSFAALPSDTLALVLSAAYRDRLEFRTWWFPITGRVPYRAYFSVSAGERERDELEREGLDTYLRPTAAFSTLGWFADPLYSTLLRQNDVSLVETVLHELAHNHLYVGGQGTFNESFATFVGHAAAIEFFCAREGGGPTTVKCARARDLWADALDVSRFITGLDARIRELYERGVRGTAAAAGVEVGPGAEPGAESVLPSGAALDALLDEREEIYAAARAEFVERVQPGLRFATYPFLATEPLNNATLLARGLYYHRLPDFDALWSRWNGDLAGLLAWMRENAPRRSNPFEILD